MLRKGKVIQSGTHDNLVAITDGVYARLVAAQALSLGSPTQEVQRYLDAEAGDPAHYDKNPSESDYGDGSVDDAKIQQNPVERGFFSSFGRFFFESKKYWPIMALSVVFTAAAGTAMPLYPWLFARSIDLFKYQDSPSRLMDEMEFMAGMWAVFAASAGIAYFLTFVSSASVSSLIRAKYQKQYFQSILFQQAAFFDEDDHSQGALTSRIKDDPQKLDEMMGTNMGMVLISIFNVIGGITMALCYSWKLALVSIAVVMPLCLFSGYFRFRYELQFEKMNDEVFAESSQFASEAIGAFRTVTSLTLEDSTSTRFDRLCHGHIKAAHKKARWVSIVLGFADSTPLGCQAFIFYYGGRLLGRGEVTFMAFFVCLMAVINVSEGFGQSLSFGPNAAQATAASNRILGARESRIVRHSAEPGVPVTDGGMKIELRDIGFTYPSGKAPALSGLSITVERGQFAALVGASGCGKTSIVSLIEGFYTPQQGQIVCNGQDIADVDIYAYRKQLSLVAQEPTLFQGRGLLVSLINSRTNFLPQVLSETTSS